MKATARRSQAGQASVELVAIVPALVILAILAAQLVAAGWAFWSASSAARAGARAAVVGGDAAAAARSALPVVLRTGSRVDAASGVEVRVAVPRLVPGLPSVPVSVRTTLPGVAGD